VGRHVKSVVHPDDLDIFVEGLRATGSGGISQDRARLLRRDGTTFIGGGQGHAFTYRGEPHTLAVIRDVTAEVRTYDLLEQRVEERTRELSAVLEVSHRVASTLDLEPLLGLILDQLKTVVDYSGAAIFIVEAEHVRVLDYRGPLQREQMLNLRIPLERALGYQAAVRQREPVIVDDLWSMTPLASEIGDLRSYFETMVGYANSLLVVPLMVKERVIGIVRIDHTEPRAYTPRHAMLAMAFASQAAIAIENARLYARAHDMATLEERHRLARELHDSVTQALYGVTMYAEAATSLMDAGQHETATSYLREVRETSQDALKEMRLLIFELRPPVLAEEGLEGALRARLTAVEGRVNGISATMDVQGDLHIPAHIEEALYGIAQETLNNIFKHARATAISVSLRQEAATLILEIVDDGAGFDPDLIQGQGGLGLGGMVERAAQAGGHLTVESTPGEGTRVRAEVTL
ncbi:MAG TPA: GAF domain-containing sensor histidine kinase, partial [Chloroflexota bacterium]